MKEINVLEKEDKTAPMITVFDRSSTNINGDFLHSELIIDALVRMNSHPSDRLELIQICRQKFKDNSVQLEFIEEFERDYTSERSLWLVRKFTG